MFPSPCTCRTELIKIKSLKYRHNLVPYQEPTKHVRVQNRTPRSPPVVWFTRKGNNLRCARNPPTPLSAIFFFSDSRFLAQTIDFLNSMLRPMVLEQTLAQTLHLPAQTNQARRPCQYPHDYSGTRITRFELVFTRLRLELLTQFPASNE